MSARAYGLLAALVASGCNALLDIDHIEFGEPVASGGAGGAGTVGTSGPGAQSTSGPGGSSGAGGGGLGGYPPSPEDCANGSDDNGDGLADCADPLCTCAPDVGSNWDGPVVLYTGALPSVCPDDWPNVIAEGFTTVSADPVTCSGCGCAPANVACTAPLSLWNVSGCSGTAAASTVMSSTACISIASNLYLSARAGTPSVSSSSSCPPTGGEVLDQPAWTQDDHAVLCGGASMGSSCTSGDSCVALPPAPFLGKVCVYRAAGGNCPGAYPEKHEFFTEVNDYRGCSACQCGAVSGASCSATTALYSASGCTGTMWSLPNNGTTCVAVSSPLSRLFSFTAMGGSCTSTGGGSPQGDVTGDSPVTVCCVP